MKKQNRKLYLSDNCGGDLQSKLSSTFVAHGQNLLYDFVVKKYHFEKKLCPIVSILSRFFSSCIELSATAINKLKFTTIMFSLIKYTYRFSHINIRINLKLIFINNLEIVDRKEL